MSLRQSRPHVLFRTDGDPEIGMGHVMRCIALAERFAEKKSPSIFLLKYYTPQVLDIIRTQGFEVEVLSAETIEPDAQLTLSIIQKYNCSMMITDLSHLRTFEDLLSHQEYLLILRQNNIFIITLDGLLEDRVSASLPVPCDLLVVPYCGASSKTYQKFDETKTLLGPQYFIFRQEFREAFSQERTFSLIAKNILVSLGSGELVSCYSKVVSALTQIKDYALKIKIILGNHYPKTEKEKLLNTLQVSQHEFEMSSTTQQMAEEMFWADVSIVGSGLIKYETAITGTPCLVLSVDKEQAQSTEEFAKSGSIVHLGVGKVVEESEIYNSILQIIENPELRQKLSENGRRLVDGKGIDRIWEEVPQLHFDHEPVDA